MSFLSRRKVEAKELAEAQYQRHINLLQDQENSCRTAGTKRDRHPATASRPSTCVRTESARTRWRSGRHKFDRRVHLHANGTWQP